MVSSSSNSRRRGALPSISSASFVLLALQAALSSAADCNTYTTTGPAGNQTFNNYVFYDFRNLNDRLSGTPVYSQNVDFPNGQFALATSSYFNSSTWTDHWSSMAYKQVANPKLFQWVDMVYTPLNVAVVPDNSTSSDGDTVLSLTTTRLQSYSPSAQIQSIQHFLHASVRMSARMLGPPGACGAFYLYGDDNNESDMELLTNDTSALFHATNHPSQDPKGNIIPGASTVGDIPLNGTASGTSEGSWSDWNDWRMDWLADRTQWIVNGELVVDKTWSPPKIASYLGINMWSNGGTWTGNMTVGQTATLQIRWIEIVYNTTSDSVSGSTNCVVKGNNDGDNTAAAASNPVSASPRLSTTSFAWALIIGAFLWALL